jgi:hypothetical protein
MSKNINLFGKFLRAFDASSQARTINHSSIRYLSDKQGIFERVFGSHVEQATQAHSVLLADKQILYELQSILKKIKINLLF